MSDDLAERTGRLQRTERRIAGIVNFHVAAGDHSNYLREALRDLEAQAKTEKAAIAALRESAARPIDLPTPADVAASSTALSDVTEADPLRAPEQLRRLFEVGRLPLHPQPECFTSARPASTSWRTSGSASTQRPPGAPEPQKRRKPGLRLSQGPGSSDPAVVQLLLRGSDSHDGARDFPAAFGAPRGVTAMDVRFAQLAGRRTTKRPSADEANDITSLRRRLSPSRSALEQDGGPAEQDGGPAWRS